MRISSPAFSRNQAIPVDFTCDGRNVNPHLHLEGIPENAKSLALIVDDPDAPGRTFVHWTLWNIDPTVRDIPENSVPAGAVQGLNDFGDVHWGGPCPPPGKPHHYRFRAFALPFRLALAWGAQQPELVKAMGDKMLAQAEWIGTYQRARVGVR